ncbi:MAG: hypothetical protein V7765_08580 [Oleispira sp.]
MLLTFFIFIVSLVGLYLYTHHGHKGLERRNHKNRQSSTSSEKRVKNNEFHCVETHHHAQCCNAVKELHGKRFLSAQAPTLPVNGCDQEHCHCDYIHHDDRRIEVRRDDVGLQHDMYGQNGETEHREPRRGRRKTD